MADTKQTPAQATGKSPEPWGIWAAILVVIAVLVGVTVTMGLSGLAIVMVLAAIAMLILLTFIVFG